MHDLSALERLIERVKGLEAEKSGLEAEFEELSEKISGSEIELEKEKAFFLEAERHYQAAKAVHQGLVDQQGPLHKRKAALETLALNLEAALDTGQCKAPEQVHGGRKTSYQTAAQIIEQLRGKEKLSPMSALRAAMGKEKLKKVDVWKRALRFGFSGSEMEVEKALYNNRTLFNKLPPPEGSARTNRGSYFQVQDQFVVELPPELIPDFTDFKESVASPAPAEVVPSREAQTPGSDDAFKDLM